MGRYNRKVLLIGWDAADWKVINALVDAGKMPRMKSFIEDGVIGNLATLYPELSPMLWTSIATGKRPYKHGILGFTEPDPQGAGIRPITNISRKTKAIWNILSQEHKKCNVVGWWPSHPAEPINGVMVSNHYHRAAAPHDKPWPMKPGTVHPERLVRNLAALRVHPQDLDPRLVMNFVPRLEEIDQEKDRRIENVAKIIADCTTVHRAVTALMRHEPWDFTAVYFDAIDHFSHGFMNYHPPRLPRIKEEDFELYRNVVESGYIYHDFLLGSLLELVDDSTTVLIVSDHGFHSDHLRPRHIPIEPAGPAVQHRPYGIFAAKGPGIVKDERIYGASLLDVCPTILSILGLPIGRDMDGKPLVNIFRDKPPILTIPSWDEVAGDDGSHPSDRKLDPVEAREAINQLVALGYIEAPPENAEKAADETVRELRYNHARSLMDGGLYPAAVPILSELRGRWPDEYRFGIQLVSCYQSIGRVSEARRLLESLLERKKGNSARAAVELREFIAARKDTPAEEISRADQIKFRRLRAHAGSNPYTMEFLLGSLLFSEGKKKEALDHLRRAEKADSRHPALHVKLGDVYLKMGSLLAAEKSYRRALSIDAESAEAMLGLSACHRRAGRVGDMADAALNAIGLRFHNPRGHFLLGVALQRMGRTEQAIQSLQVATTQNPYYSEALRRLSSIYLRDVRDTVTADLYANRAREAAEMMKRLRKEGAVATLGREAAGETAIASSQVGTQGPQFVAPSGAFDAARTLVIVSGLPRTGTSMMMQMLAAGGIAAFTDDKRVADADNPRGYLEHEKATQLRRDATWLPDARGRAVKIVAQLLPDLPKRDDLDYVVVFMERHLDDVLKSQTTMLERQGRRGAKMTDERLKHAYLRQLVQAKLSLSARKIPTVFVDYDESVRDPAAAAGKVREALGSVLDVERMVSAVDPSMKRQGRSPEQDGQS